MSAARARLCKDKTFIWIGIKRNSKDWHYLGQRIASKKWTYEDDWSLYDQTIPNVLLEATIDVRTFCFNLGDTKTYNFMNNFKNYFVNNLV